MLRINDFIFSFDVLEKKFSCDLPQCKGSCCRYGDSGAPLTQEEVGILDEIWPSIKKYVRPEGQAEIEKNGTSVKDFESDMVTPLINNEECAYTILDDGVYLCAIEKAWSEGKTGFRKPVSCHLFPVRIKQFSGFMAVNYQELPICRSACEKGQREKVFVYEFLREPLTKAIGEKIYSELCAAAAELRKSKRFK